MLRLFLRLLATALLLSALAVCTYDVARATNGFRSALVPADVQLSTLAHSLDRFEGLLQFSRPISFSAIANEPIVSILKAPAAFVFGGLGIGLAALIRLLHGARARAPSTPGSSDATKSQQVGNGKREASNSDSVDREFLPAALELLETPPAPVGIAMLWFICAFFTAALAWAYFGYLDIHAVAQGRIEPSGRSKVVQPLEPGKVVLIRVENGSRVKADDVLLELDPTETGADREAQVRELDSARAEIARRRAAIAAARSGSIEQGYIQFAKETGADAKTREEAVLLADLGELSASRASLKAQYNEHLAARDRLKASITARERVLALAKERVDMRETLNDKGSLSRAMVIDSLQQYEAQNATQVSERGQLLETEASLITLDRKMEEASSQFISEQTQKLAEAERRADRLQQELIKALSKNERSKLRAPIDGTVQQLSVTTIGQVVTTGQPLLTIVPIGGPIEIEVMIENKDIGFVESGQPAIVKIESFPFTRFGTIDGTVTKVSRDAVDSREALGLSDAKSTASPQNSMSGAMANRGQTLVFPATIGLMQKTIHVENKEIALSPGMAVTVEIRTGKRRVIDYLLSPLREVSSSSGHER